MIKKISLLGLVAVLPVVLSSCISEPVGSIYTGITNNATLINKDASEKEGIGSKTGEACASSFLNLFASGDAGIKAAASKGGITNVKSMDVSHTMVLGSLFVQKCTVVHGD